jgi:hypothetical protein
LFLLFVIIDAWSPLADETVEYAMGPDSAMTARENHSDVEFANANFCIQS